MNIRVLHITNNDCDGVGRAVLRLHKGLINFGIDSKVLVLHKKTKERGVYSIGYAKTIKITFIDLIYNCLKLDKTKLIKITKFIIFKLHSKMLGLRYRPKTLFNFGKVAVNFKELYVYFSNSDILFLHGVHEILSAEDLYKIHKKFSLKIFYHMLDMEPITGGCHFNFDCSKYRDNCNKCPQLLGNNRVAHNTLKRKFFYLKKVPINWIVPNNFALQRLKNSYIFDELHVANVIFMGIDSERYRKIEKRRARNILGLPEKTTLLFGCFNFSDKRKGAQILKESLVGDYIDDLDLDNVHLVTFGSLNGFSFKGIRPHWTHLGNIKTSKEINLLYRASDLLASPSIDDIGPTIVEEAFMNHLPIVAFNIGVAKDLVKKNINGDLAPCFNIEKYAKLISSCLIRKDELDYKNDKGLLSYEKKCSVDVEVKEFLKLCCD
jgi:glycosyltransferase involved in cell wall biosynthesis